MTLSDIEKSLSIFENKNNTVQHIYDPHYCNFCGACIHSCPVNAIEYLDPQIIVNENCIQCGKCLEVCSQNQKIRYSKQLVDIERNEQIKDVHPKIAKVPLGCFKEIWNGFSSSRKTRNVTMSGGVTTSLLYTALSENVVDAVLIPEFTEKKQNPRGKLISNPEELLLSGGSKYLPTLSLDKLNEIANNQDIERIAITTLPCQAYVIKKMFLDTQYEKLVKKIHLVLTLFCGSGIPYRDDVELFLKAKGVTESLSELKVIRRRERRIWRINPQAIERYIFITKDGKEVSISSSRILRCKTKSNCSTICPDYTGYFSDISIGASHISANIIVARTEKGRELVKLAIEKEFIKTQYFSKINNFLINLMGNNKRNLKRKSYHEFFKNKQG
ncbi:MAG: Coenzyme F420 hydrogenase/dehydrogenase, beta subunit C-terminal domain [Candidatus Heimdallarchaeota archaeon]|nr:Coenzyme F420 hydrogenase/dehydrogenase, beta subunit C-terminal domain [Candidatus Heimdallarchaeota archaeon]MCK5144072.1 Coenzyme F420 hydrogenase/dehydrogenase, beta subunit C-terminal domain [Candidatus Heimdallarchaeota archaeon]